MSIAIAPEAPLWRATKLDLVCSRSGEGQTVEVRLPGGGAVASGDGRGTICDATAGVLLRAPIRFDGRRGVVLDVADGLERPLGSARVQRYAIGPRARRATVVVSDVARAPVGSLEPRDRKGHDVALLAADGAEVGTLRRTGHRRGLLRSSTAYRLEVDGHMRGTGQALILAAALRYHAVLAAVASSGD